MKDKFIVLGSNGKNVECDVLFTFDSLETNKSYVVYTDNSEDEDGSVRIYASTYILNGDKLELNPVETDEEWEIIEAVLDESKKQIEDKSN